MELYLKSSHQSSISDGSLWIKMAFVISAIVILGLSGFYALMEGLRVPPAAPAIQRHWLAPEIIAPDVRVESAAGFYDNALSRPIFSRERRRLARVAASGNIPRSHLSPSIFAIVISKTVRKAFMSVDEKSEAAWVRVGDKVGEWTLAAIEKNKIEFVEGADKEAFDLYGLNSSEGAIASPSRMGIGTGIGAGIENRQGRSRRTAKGKKMAYSSISKIH